MRVHAIQHAVFEGPGSIAAWAAARKHAFTTTQVYGGESLPDPEQFEFLVLMGGPMSVHDETTYPWLRDEKRFIGHSIEAGKIVLGVCLGSQLLAEVLGATVTTNNEKEIGWYSVEKTIDSDQWAPGRIFPPVMEVFQWHGETFSLPPGSVRLWRSAACEQQGFAFGDRLLGLQFHLELGLSNLEGLIAHCRGELVEGRWIQGEAEMLSIPGRFSAANAMMEKLLDEFVSRGRIGPALNTSDDLRRSPS